MILFNCVKTLRQRNLYCFNVSVIWFFSLQIVSDNTVKQSLVKLPYIRLLLIYSLRIIWSVNKHTFLLHEANVCHHYKYVSSFCSEYFFFLSWLNTFIIMHHRRWYIRHLNLQLTHLADLDKLLHHPHEELWYISTRMIDVAHLTKYGAIEHTTQTIFITITPPRDARSTWTILIAINRRHNILS